MHILTILTTYNEIDYMPLKQKWCNNNDLDLYVIDNMSNDGTWDWLNDNNISCHQFDTNEEFHLEKLQQEIISTVHKIKPDWVYYNGADTFIQLKEEKTLQQYVKEQDEIGNNMLFVDLLNFCYTGEEHKNFDPFNTFFYYKKVKPVRQLHKYIDGFYYLADLVHMPPKIGKKNEIDGIMLNFGDTKLTEKRLETYKRRKLAWKNGLEKGHGDHYVKAKKHNWLWEKKALKDIRKSEYADYYKRGF